MSNSERTLTTEEFRVLLYLKWLEECDEEEYHNCTLGQKIDIHESEPLGMDAFDFYDVLDKFVYLEIWNMMKSMRFMN